MQIKIDGVVREVEYSRSRMGWYWYFVMGPTIENPRARVRVGEHSLPIRVEEQHTFSIRSGGHLYESVKP